MGLDMYAYTINKNLVDGLPETNLSLRDITWTACGYKDEPISEEKVAQMTQEDWEAHYAKQASINAIVKAACGFDDAFAYWRKFNALHGWMHRLYESKGGEGEFNCDTVRLNPEDIDELEKAAMEKSLSPVPGFFFGSQEEFNDEDREEVLNFCSKCRSAFSEGKAVFYNSWW